MEIRTYLNERPQIAYIACGAMLAIALFWCYLQFPRTPGLPTQRFYSSDDGKTWFADDIHKVPPFDKGGATAVRAYVFKSSTGGTPFVGYLEKYPDDVKQKLEAAHKERSTPTPADYMLADNTNCLVKRPGDANWVKEGGPVGFQMTNVRLKDGMALPIEVGE